MSAGAQHLLEVLAVGVVGVVEHVAVGVAARFAEGHVGVERPVVGEAAVELELERLVVAIWLS